MQLNAYFVNGVILIPAIRMIVSLLVFFCTVGSLRKCKTAGDNARADKKRLGFSYDANSPTTQMAFYDGLIMCAFRE